MEFTDQDLVAATAAVCIVILLFVRHEHGALLALKDKRLISTGTYEKKFTRLRHFAMCLMVAVMFAVVVAYQYIPQNP